MTRCVSSVNPAFNRCVLFNTIPKSYHGHPHKLSCPPGETRKHILLYYYRDEGADLALTPTDYKALPSDSAFKKAMVAVDSALLRACSSGARDRSRNPGAAAFSLDVRVWVLCQTPTESSRGGVGPTASCEPSSSGSPSSWSPS